MKIKYLRCLAGMLAAVALLLSASCSEHVNPNPSPSGTRRAILVYAAAFNSLSYSFAEDMTEMVEGMELAGADADSCRWLVYRTDYDSQQALWELKRDDNGVVQWRKLADYDKSELSTEPGRMSEVIRDFCRLTDGVRERGLILWSRATGWMPARHTSGKFWFGGDTSQGTDSPMRHMDILDLAEAVPKNVFSFIWADCCCMGGIEVAWQLRHHCKIFVGYPTEVLADGMPYDKTLPVLLRKQLDITAAAKIFYEHYNSKSGVEQSATIGVVNTAALPALAAVCRIMMAGKTVPSGFGLQAYHRPNSGIGPFYDLREVCRAYAALQNMTELPNDADRAFADAIPYAAATTRFLEIRIDPSRFCGISSNLWREDGSNANTYYKSLDWYKAVYQ